MILKKYSFFCFIICFYFFNIANISAADNLEIIPDSITANQIDDYFEITDETDIMEACQKRYINFSSWLMNWQYIWGLASCDQSGCNGDSSQKQVNSIIKNLNQKSPKNIYFNPDFLKPGKKKGYEVKGGNCTAMSLSFISYYTHARKQFESLPKSDLINYYFLSSLVNIEDDYSSNNMKESFKDLQTAFNTIEVIDNNQAKDNNNETNIFKSKISAMTRLLGYEVTFSSDIYTLRPDNRSMFDREITFKKIFDNLDNGIYVLRGVKVFHDNNLIEHKKKIDEYNIQLVNLKNNFEQWKNKLKEDKKQVSDYNAESKEHQIKINKIKDKIKDLKNQLVEFKRKLEAYGHTAIYIKDPDFGEFLFDPNHGIKKYTKEPHLYIYDWIRSVGQLFELNEFTFHKIDFDF